MLNLSCGLEVILFVHHKSSFLGKESVIYGSKE